MYKVIKYHWAAIFMSLIILVLCNVPTPASTNEAGFFFTGVDKLVHFGMFFLLASCLILGERKRIQQKGLKPSQLILIFLYCVSFGAIVEWLQYAVFTYRSAELWDFICDSAGALLSLLFYYLLDKQTLV
ncbi:MAG: glycine cleavage system protein H [Pedobacter sp.]|nr:MAG: glycine cleavage system protein H [Pedobacter sp.]